MFRVREVVQCSLITYQRNRVTFGWECITIETIMLLHLTRVDDVMCFKHFSFLFLVHQWLAVNVVEKWTLEILKNQGKAVLLKTLIILSLSNALHFVEKWHFHLLLVRMYKDTYKTFSMEVSDVKILWNAKSRQYFHFKFQQGDEERRVTSSSHKQCRHANGEEYSMSKVS